MVGIVPVYELLDIFIIPCENRPIGQFSARFMLLIYLSPVRVGIGDLHLNLDILNTTG